MPSSFLLFFPPSIIYIYIFRLALKPLQQHLWRALSKASSSNLVGHLALQVLNQCLELRLGLICSVIGVARVKKDIGKGLEQMVNMSHDEIGLSSEQLEESLVDRTVLERVKPERKDRDDNGNNIGKRESSGVLGDHTSNGTGSVVTSVVESRRGVLRRSEERVEGMEESRVVGREVGVRVLDEDT